jgi:glycerol-3-phosphate dehydrogenase (NAD(P)+)
MVGVSSSAVPEIKLSVLGAGAWGTALAISLARKSPQTTARVCLWGRDSGQLQRIRESRCNHRYLPSAHVPESIEIQMDLDAALQQADLVILATPVAALRHMLQKMKLQGYRGPLIWLCKGFEPETSKLPHQIFDEEMNGAEYGVLSGPSFALEVAEDRPTALTLASGDLVFARSWAARLHHPNLRIYYSDDVRGVEVGGAVKNVMAIATGICDGMALGLNARAALITRGLAEISRLGIRLGGRAETFMGLTGLGDLILTCTGNLSRNRTVGLRLANGESLDSILRDLGHVAEGVNSARETHRLAVAAGIEMPITRAVCEILFEGVPPGNALKALLLRDPRDER